MGTTCDGIPLLDMSFKGFNSEWLKTQGSKLSHVEQSKPPTKAIDQEKDLHKEIINFCERQKWIACHGAMHRPTFRTTGEPDFIILAPRCVTIYVECKARDEGPSDGQREFHEHAAVLGHAVHVVRTFQEFIAAVNSHLETGCWFDGNGYLAAVGQHL